jgi:predicted amidophosphoribosyltransferase
VSLATATAVAALGVVEPRRPKGRLVPVSAPDPGPGVCKICRGPARHRVAYCWCCTRVCASLGMIPARVPPVIPVGLCATGDAWNTSLRRYKDAPVAAARRHFAELIAGEVESFLRGNERDVEELTGGFDSYCVVPSSRTQRLRDAMHPLSKVLARVEFLGGLEVLRLAPSSSHSTSHAGHMKPSSLAFVVSDPAMAHGRRVLVVDDSWVTGSRALSAVSVLAGAGSTVAGVLVLGRLINPAASEYSHQWWESVVNPRGVVNPGQERVAL